MKLLFCIVLFNSVLSSCYSQDLVYTANAKKNFLFNNIELEASYSGLKIIQATNGEPHYTILRSTPGLAGSSKTFKTTNGTYYVSQSIGQLSVIGTHKNNNYTLVQGFQQPIISAKIIWSPLNILKATIYPNPFNQSINIQLDEPVTNDLFIMVFGVEGKTVFSKKYPASQRVNIPLDYISKGIYILKVTTGDKIFKAKLLKE